MSESLLGQLQDRDAKQAVLDATFALFNRWHLHEINQAQLLGLPNITALKRQQPESVAPAMLARMGKILAIDRALNKYFRYEPHTRDQWLFQPREELQGEPPLAVMLSEGEQGIRKVKQLAESLVEV